MAGEVGARRIRAFIAALLIAAAALIGLAIHRDRPVDRADTSRAAAERPSEHELNATTRANGPEAHGVTVAEPHPDAKGAALVIRDLATGLPVPDVPVVVTLDAGERSLRSNERGEVEFDRGTARSIRVEGDVWQRARKRGSGLNGTGILWVYREMRVDGVLRNRLGEPVDVEDARFAAIIDDYGVSPAGWTGPSERFRSKALDERGPVSFERIEGEGRFRLSLPRIRGVTLTASKAGWRTGSIALDPWLRSTDASVEIVIERGFVVRGRLLDENGRPFDRAGVQVYTIVRLPADEILEGPSPQRLSPGGYAATASLATGEGYLKFAAGARTDADGNFEVVIDAPPGHSWLMAQGKGSRRVEYELGSAATDVDGISLVAPSAEGAPRIRLVDDGEPLARRGFVLCDLDFGNAEAQPAIELRTDADGEFPSAWLVRGRRYSVGMLPNEEPTDDPRRICLRWDGQTSIDFTRDRHTYDELFPR